MIEISATHAFLLYLGSCLIALLGLWGYQHFRTRKQRISLEAQLLVKCEYCHTAYLADVVRSVSRCPCCQAFNKR